MRFYKKFFNGKKILITGHTGFKGSWLTLWLHGLGANILGISSGIPTNPSHLSLLKINKKINSKKNEYSKFKIINKSN